MEMAQRLKELILSAGAGDVGFAETEDGVNGLKYADTVIEELVRMMERAGAVRCRLTAKIAGGAKMFAATGIGERNIISVKIQLLRLGIRLIGDDTGESHGRTVEFHPEDGSVIIKSVKHGNSMI